ncbi:class I SAM-dependent methyltransferase [Marinobacter sp. 1_MG-2023]|uniref:class I SAM-dependent methyltransferase n=1 Tax=Marinobacter sp. 1_MG-2023 TaxID=3062627 RepID=UPI0026E33241|nr:class I SAM-dependent methyltransferase [Marinobacter sp. 1_MG-2023]MDO6823857.1 class I SAM-dependent methyltransferase [Marinobacter sp. 1_MG-2023]
MMAEVILCEGSACSVCGQGRLTRFRAVQGREYLRCPHCEATIMAQANWLTSEEEQTVYNLHDNDPADPGYRAFLNKLVVPLLECIQPGALGLDFGCGPGPALAGMLREAGMEVKLYDPFFYPSQAALGRQYDFITCTEVVEHLHRPAKVLRQLDGLLKPGGWLGVMTCFQTCDERFDNWHYRRDPTHVVFYREKTLAQIADHLGWVLSVPRKDVAIFHKPL